VPLLYDQSVSQGFMAYQIVLGAIAAFFAYRQTT
jgi:hypothetical protein